MSTGALLVDKPEGLTSHDVVVRVRGLMKERRCGHTGTLDPFATGLLVLCLGRATRLARFVAEASKTYRATVRFGFPTDTYDRTGRPGSDERDPPSLQNLREALPSFLGVQQQIPPPFSAKRVAGVRAYRLARAGVVVQPAAVRVRIDELELLDFVPPRAELRVSASSGTYVRSLAHDLGKKLGCGAHLEALRRTRVGSFRVEDASTLDVLQDLAAEGRLSERLLSPARVLQDLPAEELTADEAERFIHGRTVFHAGAPAERTRVVGPGGEFLGVARAEGADGGLRPLIVWAAPGKAPEA